MRLLLIAALASAFNFGGPRDILMAGEIHALADTLEELAAECRALRKEPYLERAKALHENVSSARRKKDGLRTDSDTDVVEVALRRLSEETEDFERALDALVQEADDTPLEEEVDAARWAWTRS